MLNFFFLFNLTNLKTFSVQFIKRFSFFLRDINWLKFMLFFVCVFPLTPCINMS